MAENRPQIGTNSAAGGHTLLNFDRKWPIVLGSTFQERCPQTTKNPLRMTSESLELLGKSCKM